ncbi:DUF3987 domain-containing protein [Magnetospirillum sp. SS-4]|uniref:DUF3987 domain-containing protein n=1 Tax=Magnetospirillum sp. SS-4 TaxID=2681465 RepID=UPI001382D945|nr:DUF3987 domain-containing protein [Magnetospirillum sp. SS-4]CAA7619024.1 hypothetical protein MTBSS4_230020 [Magnetospirillum sp. SS-4]
MSQFQNFPTPKPIQNPIETPKFPLPALGPLASTFQKLADGACAPVDYIVATALAVMAALIGNTRVIRLSWGWDEPCALWFLLVGRASNSKSPGMRAVTQSLQPVLRDEAEEYRQAFKRYEAGDLPSAPRNVRWISSNMSNEMLVQQGELNPRGQLILSKEGAPFLQGKNDFFLDSFCADSVTRDRISTNSNACERLLASCVGAVHPCDVEKLVARKVGDGGLARCLVTEPERRPFAFPDEIDSHPDLSPIFRALRAIPLGETPVAVELVGQERADFEAWAQANDAKEVEDALDYHFAKLRGIAARLAMVLDYAWAAAEGRSFPTTLSRPAVVSAIGMIERYWKPMARKVYRLRTQTGASEDAQKLARWILAGRYTRINKREIYKHAGLPGLTDPAPVQTALDELMHFGWLRRLSEKTGAGRKPEDYDVNPAVFDLPEAV